MKAVQLIREDECNITRLSVQNRNGESIGHLSFGFDSLGDLNIVNGSGRATCRQCGEKIRKDEKAIKGVYDFDGCGSWTAVNVQIHLNTCRVVTQP